MEAKKEKSRIMLTLKKTIGELFAFTLWLYMVIKLFVFDFDVYIVDTYFPSLSWLVYFKFLLFLVLIMIYWIFVGDKNFFKAIAFVLFYPFILLFWRIPNLFIGNWFAIIGAIGFGISFYRSLKRNYITFTLITLSSILIIITNKQIYLIASMIVLSSILLIHFARRLFYSFVPSKALFLPKQAVLTLLERTKSNLKLPEELRTTAIEKYTEEQKNKWSYTLQTLLLINRVSYYVASKLRELQERRLVILYFIFGLLFSFCLTVVIFALNNYALQKIDATAFSNPSHKGLLFFIYYSFSTIINSAITDFYPISAFARLFHLSEVFMGVFLLVILFFVYTNVKSDKTKSEVNDLISTLGAQGKEIEVLINHDFSMDINQAIEVVEKFPGSLLRLFYFITTKKR
ncbi:MAG: hypothetical protein ABSA44_08125 [Bacteroidota bacterium]|jgi:hypothetical protein